MPPKKQNRDEASSRSDVVCSLNDILPADIVGVIAGFAPQTTRAQLSLMLVCHTWFRGVVEQDGMKPKPGVMWPWPALALRQAKRVWLVGRDDPAKLRKVAEHLPQLEELKLQAHHTDIAHLKLLNTDFDFISRDQPAMVGTLEDFRNLSVLDVSNCNLLAVGNLRTLGTLSCVDITGCEMACSHFCHLPKSLTTLKINRQQHLALSGISFYLPQLTTLEISVLQTGVVESHDLLQELPKLMNLQAMVLGLSHATTTLQGKAEYVSLVTQLVPLLPNLTSLDLDIADPSESMFRTIAEHPKLNTFKIHTNRIANHETLRALASIRTLTQLSVQSSFPTCGSACFEHMQQLRSLSFPIDGKSLQIGELTNLLHLTEVCVGNSQYCTDSHLHAISTCPNLTSLNINACTTITARGFQRVAPMLKGLKTLLADEMPSVSDSLDHVAEHMAHLSVLRVCGISNSNLKHLSAMQSLSTLELIESSITDEGLMHLGKLKGLTSLNLEYSTEFTGAGFTHLVQKLPSLTSLSLEGCVNVGLNGITLLTSVESLRILNVSSIDLADAAISRIAKMVNLAELQISLHEKNTDVGLHELLDLCRLRSVVIDGRFCLTQSSKDHLSKSLGLRFVVAEE